MYLEEYRSSVRAEGIELDEVQLEACEALEEGHDVLLCAPTGSGKTMVARFAVELALTHATTCVYTAPIKALSNQKYREMAEVYGEDQVGLMTGDVTINREAPIIVMTTEVLRNLIYARDPFAAGLGYVVLDEVHYLADEERGPVWEEILLELPEHTTVVSLSATVANTEEFHAWLESIRGTTRLVHTNERPVPLVQHLARGRRIVPLFGGEAESELTATRPLTQQSSDMLASRQLPERVGPRQRARVLEEMQHRDLLPAIHFIYSRKGCEMAVRDLDREHVILTTKEERAAIHLALDPLRAELTDDDAQALHFRSFERALSRGYAAHHAGVYPALKEVIERLMQAGHLKLVYATGTLALGINMPVRTTVIESLRRFNGTEFTNLSRIEYTQLIGRAGRRGRDKVGHAIVLACEDTASIADTATGELEPLVSAFFPSYNTVLNVLTTYDYASARALLARSFAQYQANRDLARLEIKRDRIRREIQAQEERLEGACDKGSLPEYLRIRLSSGRAASRARKRARADYRRKVEESFFRVRSGKIVAYATEQGLTYGYVAQAPQAGKAPRMRVANWFGDLVWVRLTDLRSEVRVVGTMALPYGMKLRDAHARARVADQIIDQLASRTNVDLDTDLLLPWDRGAVRESEELLAHPVHSCEHLAEHLAEGEEYLTLLRRANDMEAMAGQFTDSVGAEFDTTCSLLAHLGLLQGEPGDYRMGPGATTLKRIHASSDLTIYRCLLDPRITELPVHEFAGMMSAFTFKDPRGRSVPPVNSLAWRAIVHHHEDIVSLEESYGLDRQGSITANATRSVAAWAQGAGLNECLNIGNLLPGDFIIGMRRTADLLAHITQATDGELSDKAYAARQAIVRSGVVDTP